MRCFVSIELPGNVKAEIVHAFEKLEKSGTCSGSFVPKENLHLTLKFLGDISLEKIAEIKEVLSKMEFNRFPVEMGEVGFFPSEDHVNILWVGLSSENIKLLNEGVENELSKIGINKEEREFSSHITVARIKQIKNNEMFLHEVKRLKIKKDFFIVEGMNLIKSERRKKGVVYKLLENFNFRS